MGGFMINGCGVAESFKPIAVLPGHTCRRCGKANYAVMEARNKIRVLFIPTFTVGVKYVIACSKCENGYYISEEQKDYVLQHGAKCVEVTDKGVLIHKVAPQPSIPAPQPPAPPAPTPVPPAPQPSQSLRCECGCVPDPGSIFCPDCGKKLRQPTPRCSVCGSEVNATAIFCSHCGNALR